MSCSHFLGPLCLWQCFSDTHCSYLPCICKCGSNQPENPRRLPDFRFPARNPRRHTALSFYQPHYLFRQNKNIQTSNCISNRTILTLTSKLIECIIFFKLTLDILHHLNTDQQCFPSTNVILSFSLWSCQIYVQYAHSTKFSIQFICISHCFCICICLCHCLFIKSEMTKRGDRIFPIGGSSNWFVFIIVFASVFVFVIVFS